MLVRSHPHMAVKERVSRGITCHYHQPNKRFSAEGEFLTSFESAPAAPIIKNPIADKENRPISNLSFSSKVRVILRNFNPPPPETFSVKRPPHGEGLLQLLPGLSYKRHMHFMFATNVLAIGLLLPLIQKSTIQLCMTSL